MRMRRTFNVIISCFTVLYPVGLIFYKVNHSCRMSCTTHIPPHPNKRHQPFLGENLLNINILLNCLYRSEMSRCSSCKNRIAYFGLYEVNISSSELQFTLKVLHVIVQLLTVCIRWPDHLKQRIKSQGGTPAALAN